MRNQSLLGFVACLASKTSPFGNKSERSRPPLGYRIQKKGGSAHSQRLDGAGWEEGKLDLSNGLHGSSRDLVS